jgi:alpha-tubulin suppressor-like RCC1 family protein
VTTGNKAYCWGYGALGQIGDGKTFQRRWPRAVAGQLSFRQVFAGGAHSCGVTHDDRAYCWGNNFDGRIGDGTNTDRLKPVAVAGGLRFSGLNAGTVHTCAVSTADRAYCWGNNTAGQLGDGTTTHRSVPVPVSGGLRIDGVSPGSGSENTHTCGVTTANRAYCWGSNLLGQLGDGTRTDRPTPVAVASPAP